VMLAVWINKGLVTRLVDTNKKQEVIRVRYKLNPKDTLSLNVTM
jgi:putative ferrous iron transport protein C